MKKDRIDWLLLAQVIIGCIFYIVAAIIAYNDSSLRDIERLPIYLFTIIWFSLIVLVLKSKL
jgi:uncharacterized membrane protein SirB2